MQENGLYKFHTIISEVSSFVSNPVFKIHFTVYIVIHLYNYDIPFFLQTSLSFSYLLHNLMLKELFGKALKCKNKKQEARRKNKLNRKKVEGKSLDSRDGCLK